MRVPKGDNPILKCAPIKRTPTKKFIHDPYITVYTPKKKKRFAFSLIFYADTPAVNRSSVSLHPVLRSHPTLFAWATVKPAPVTIATVAAGGSICGTRRMSFGGPNERVSLFGSKDTYRRDVRQDYRDKIRRVSSAPPRAPLTTTNPRAPLSPHDEVRFPEQCVSDNNGGFVWMFRGKMGVFFCAGKKKIECR